MKITDSIKVYLDEKRLTPTVNAVQGDTARALAISLYYDGAAWTIPSEVTSVLVRFRKDDGTGGVYSKLPNGAAAWSVSSNKVTVTLAPQVLTAPGPAEVQVALVAGSDILAAFTVIVRVQRDPSIGVLESEDYINLESWKVLQSELLAKGVTTRMDVSYASGSINTGTGAEANQATRIRSGYFPARYNQKIGVIAPSNVKWRMVAYDADLSFLNAGQHGSFVTGSGEYTPKNTATAFGRLIVGYADDTEVADVEALASLVTVYWPVEVGNPVLKWYALGDSITQGYYSDTDGLKLDESQGWAALTAMYNGWMLTNHAVGGSGYVCPATVGGRLNARNHVDAIDFSDAELVTLAFGVNDWKGEYPLGAMGDDVATGGTFYSNMRYCIEKILTDQPCAKLVVISPVNCSVYGAKESNWGMGHRFAGRTLEDFCEAEREICTYYGIEFVDLLHGSVINRENIQTLLPDGVHPTLDCHRLLAVELSRKLMGTNPAAAPGGTELPVSLQPLTINIIAGEDGYVADKDIGDIQAADEAGREIRCELNTNDGQWLILPLAKIEGGVAHFAAVVDGQEYRVEIGPDGVEVVCEGLTPDPLEFAVTAAADGTLTADKTFQEVFGAYQKNISVRCLYADYILQPVVINSTLMIFNATNGAIYRTVQYTASGGLTVYAGEVGEGGSGTAGGYYTPTVTQVDDTTAEFSFSPSADGMPEVAAQQVTLPRGPQGEAGKDGTSPVVSVSAIAGGHRITITDTNGSKTVDVMDGSDGKDGGDGSPGQNGSDGVGIASIKQTTTSTADGGDNVFTVTLTNGTTATFTVKNGSKGSTGADGKDGSDGKDGTSVTVKSVSESTADGGSNVVTFSDGNTVTIKNGKTGVAGKDAVLTMFISPNGSDSNDGLTADAPKKTVNACVNAGATRISAKRGVYKEIVHLSNIGELEILPTDNDLAYAVGVEREPIVFDTSDTVAVSSLGTYNAIKRVAYSNSANTQFAKVFTAQSQTPLVGTGYGSRYNATVWLLSEDEKTVCNKLKPVLTVAECEAEANTFSYVDGYLYINADMTGVEKIVIPTNWDCGIYINGVGRFVLKEVEVRFAGSYNIDVRNCTYFDFYKCACKYTSYGSGFHPFNSNGLMTACYATKNYDGYGISGYGHTTYIDCISEFNFDDGMSHHNGTSGTVIGGRFEGNGKGGNTPAYGAKVNIYGGLYKDNASFGIGYLWATDLEPARGTVQGATMEGNPIGLSVQTNCDVTAIDCTYQDNTSDKSVSGNLTEYNINYVKTVNGEEPDESGNVEVNGWGTSFHTNVLPRAINSNGTEYVGDNGEDGYRVGYRVSSSGEEKELGSTCCTGFIPVSAGDVVRVKNFTPETSGYGTIYFFTSVFAVGAGTLYTQDGSSGNYIRPDDNGVLTFTVPDTGCIYFRLTAAVIDETTIITINEEIDGIEVPQALVDAVIARLPIYDGGVE